MYFRKSVLILPRTICLNRFASRSIFRTTVVEPSPLGDSRLVPTRFFRSKRPKKGAAPTTPPTHLAAVGPGTAFRLFRFGESRAQHVALAALGSDRTTHMAKIDVRRWMRKTGGRRLCSKKRQIGWSEAAADRLHYPQQILDRSNIKIQLRFPNSFRVEGPDPAAGPGPLRA